MKRTDSSAGGQTGGWWRGNLHCHSLWSDGDEFPERVAQRYRELGYHFIAITDHDALEEGERTVADDARPTTPARMDDLLATFGEAWVEPCIEDGRRRVRLKPFEEYRPRVEESGRFMVMTGEEVTVRPPTHPHYMNAWNLRDALSPVDAPDAVAGMRAVVDAVRAQADEAARPIGLQLNHPNWQWCAVAEDIARVKGLRFMEVFTGLRGTNSHGDELRASPERIWDVVLSLRLAAEGGEMLYGLATDDAHRYDEPDQTAGRAWVMVRAEQLAPEAILGAMARGHFYASTGVTLRDVAFDGRSLAVEIEPEPGVAYRAEFIGTRRGFDTTSEPVCNADGEPLRTTRRYPDDVGRVLAASDDLRPRFTLTGDELYARARITSTAPHPLPHAPGDTQCAWTQPVAPSDFVKGS